MQGAPSDRSWLERHVLPITIGLVAFVFLLVGLLLGDLLGEDPSPSAVTSTPEEGTTSSSADEPTESTASDDTASITSTSSVSSTTSSSTTSTLAPYLASDPHPDFQFHPLGMAVGLTVDLDTMTTACSVGCDLEVVEIIGVSGDEYTAVILPVGSAEIAEFEFDAQPDVILEWSRCQEAEIALDANKVAAPLYQTQLDGQPFGAHWFCVRTDEGNWALLAARLNGNTPGGLFALTAIAPGWTNERVIDAIIP